MIKINKALTILGIAGVILSSCKKFVEIPPPQTQVETEVIFNDPQAAIAAVAGVYSGMMQTSLSFANGAITLYPGLSADELTNTAANADYDLFRTNDLLSTSTLGLNRIWQAGYKNIYHINAILDALKKSVGITDSLKQQLKGEMQVVRAFHYLYLVNLFGEVPIVTSTDFSNNGILKRSPSGEVYKLIVDDLKDSKTLLLDAYPSTGRVRPNKWTAVALLARVQLYLKNWGEAEAEASSLINSGSYTLVPNLNNVFLAGSNEGIWQLSPVSTTINTGEGNTFIPSSASTRPTFTATSSLMSAFEPNDLRKTNWLKSVTISSVIYNYPFKYKVRSAAPPYTEYYTVIRLAEMFLIRAEARAQLNNISGAQDDLNKIRNRAGLLNTNASTQSLLLKAIMLERRVELMMEWGHRWLDLKRWSVASEVLSPLKGNTWQDTDILYPISKYELDTDPFLTQNPGYQ